MMVAQEIGRMRDYKGLESYSEGAKTFCREMTAVMSVGKNRSA
jgi:hypothetical protein